MTTSAGNNPKPPPLCRHPNEPLPLGSASRRITQASAGEPGRTALFALLSSSCASPAFVHLRGASSGGRRAGTAAELHHHAPRAGTHVRRRAYTAHPCVCVCPCSVRAPRLASRWPCDVASWQRFLGAAGFTAQGREGKGGRTQAWGTGKKRKGKCTDGGSGRDPCVASCRGLSVESGLP
jgi:hypothetical protein